MGLLKIIIGVALVLLAFYAVNEVAGLIDFDYPGFRWGRPEHVSGMSPALMRTPPVPCHIADVVAFISLLVRPL